MSERSKPVLQALRFCADCVLLLACWVLWLALGALLALQIAVIVSKEFDVPGFALRSLEEKFNASDVHAHFGRARFDVRGGILLENLQLTLPEFAEPVVDLRAAYVELDPWSLLAGRFQPHRVQATGARLFVPAMFAPSGRHEEIVSELDLSVLPGDREVQIESASGRLAGVAVALRGRVALPARPDTGKIAPLPLLQTLARNYPALSRQLVRVREQLAPLDGPELDVVLQPVAARGALAKVVLTATALSYPRFSDLRAANVRALTQLPLLGDTPYLTPLHVTAAEVTVGEARARHVEADVTGLLEPAHFYYTPQTLRLTAAELGARGFQLEHLAAGLQPQPLPLVRGELIARSLGRPIALSGEADLTGRTADVVFQGELSPELMKPLAALLPRDPRPFVGFGQPLTVDARARFGRGWKFEHAAGRLAAREIDAYHVPLDSVAGEFEFDGRRFTARHARARLGEDFARGSFTQDLRTREYRFVLDGRLRPAHIGGWFRSWWTEFFEHFEFPDAPPDASVDVHGWWRDGWKTTVFLFAESNHALIRGAELDYARTLMFIRPNFIDGLELYGTRGTGEIRGEFTRGYDFERRDWTHLAFTFASGIDLETGAALLGPKLGPRLAPYRFAEPPRLKVSGQFDGPAAPGGEHQNLQIDASSLGEFSAYEFPGQNLSFIATLKDDELGIENISADIAGGAVAGRARIWGREPERRIRFEGTVHQANLGLAVTTVSQHLARRRGDSVPRAERVQPGYNTAKLELAASAEGRVDDPLSFTGNGSASIVGPELGQVRLLGLLSDLLNFTALRFTHAQGNFKIEGPKVSFPSVNVTGANSAIQAHGSYSLARRELDFNARVYPFQESSSLLQNVVGVMLTPLSAVLEVKLTGGLDEPKWAFVIGPTNLFRALSEPTESAAPPPGNSSSASPSETSGR
ncbi:AsmA-like C-terminal region-containing protein [Opitutus terrae]|uniref:Uncharacterized protein n=1 Tax=Opitutus terrae (strain DSM 11246 / JCM 15787 / PB90-1) TaxID=452637 RepID=B1ZMC9_OPITP|nr:AsmA-like C-terminal region-containing protein [Opitutus terrae]ACB73382.1 hypothetical protein Oter_0091 [Opitutus terrae PB90-1]